MADGGMAKEIIQLWIGIAATFSAFLVFLGWRINKNILGILIDSRDKMSLSRLQVILWTVTLTSCFFAIGVSEETMKIKLDDDLLALMGVSLGAAAGSVIVRGRKDGATPDPAALANLSTSAVGSKAAQSRRGVTHVNDAPSDAKLVDIFKGEEITDHGYVDISKVQMFFFSIAVWLGYISQLVGWEVVRSTDPSGGEFIALPALSSSLVTILGISHAGYLTVKAAPKVNAQ